MPRYRVHSSYLNPTAREVDENFNTYEDAAGHAQSVMMDRTCWYVAIFRYETGGQARPVKLETWINAKTGPWEHTVWSRDPF